MRVTLTSTSRVVGIVGANGTVPGRVWEGTTDSGIRVFAVVTRIAVREDADLSQFEAELERQADPVARVHGGHPEPVGAVTDAHTIVPAWGPEQRPVPCAYPYPPSRNLTCVRVPGHLGRHVWVSDDNELSSTVTWRDHAEDCTCIYCTATAGHRQLKSGPTGGGGEPTAASGPAASIVARAPSSTRGPVTSEEE